MGELTEFINGLKAKYYDYCVRTTVENPKVSVIIPVFNGEDYIEYCLSSIIKQTLKDTEIIVVNDGSEDLTSEIVHSFKDIDMRINVISQKNKGVSAARNRGIEEAKGEYITFVDADDWVDNDYLEKLYNSAVKNNCDISVSTMVRKRENSQKYRMYFTEEKVYTTLADKVNVCRIPVCCYACGKLFRKELAKSLKFKENVYFEDVIWTPQAIDMSDKLVTVPDTIYWYRVNTNSIVKKTPNKKKQLDSYKAKKFAIEYLSAKGINFSKKTKNLTKETKYICGVPLLKIKEQNDILTTLLFSFIPLYKKPALKKLKYSTIKKALFIRNLDAHYHIELFKCLKISFKNNHKFKYTETQEYGLENNSRETKLIVSLTSFPDRIKTVHITINTLLNQTVKPDKLILWLADSQFPNKENDLPDELLKLKGLGLEIRWCEDLKSYKKLIPALKEFPEDIIVTADDDLYYQRDWLESLYSAYLENQNYIYTRRACGIKLENNILSITPHYANSNYKPTLLNQLLGGAGTLYPPHSLNEDVFNTDLIKTLIPTHDDIYFWIMAVLNGTRIRLIKNKDVSIYNVEGSQTTALCKQHINRQVGMHPSKAFSKILEYYPQAYDLIEEDSAC